MDPKTKCQKCLEPTSFQVKTFECRGPLNACKWNRLVLSCRISNVKMPMPDATWSGNKNRTEYKAGKYGKGLIYFRAIYRSLYSIPFQCSSGPEEGKFFLAEILASSKLALYYLSGNDFQILHQIPWRTTACPTEISGNSMSLLSLLFCYFYVYGYQRPHLQPN